MMRFIIYYLFLSFAAPVHAETAQTTADLLNALGIVGRPVPATASTVVAQLRQLGIRHARVVPNATASQALPVLCQAGIGLLVLQDSTPSLAVAKSLGRDCIDAVEGGNEINNHPERFHYGALVGLPAVEACSMAMWQEAQVWDSRLPVLTPSQSVGRPILGGDMRATANHGNVHSYTSQGYPPAFGMASQIKVQTGANAPGLPFWITETGYADYVGGVSEADQAVRLLQSLLDGLRFGAKRVYLYQLQDFCPDATNPECRYGVFRQDGSPKPAATAIGNFTRILADEGQPIANPQAMPLHWSGVPNGSVSMQFVASDRSTWVVLWREAPPSPVPPQTVTMGIAQPGRFTVFDPVAGMSPLPVTPKATEVTVELGMDPLLIHVGRM